VLYNVYLHPLCKYPGPRLAAASRLWYCFHCYRGTLVHTLHALHEKYGDAVRTAPNELSFTSPSAWNDIYGHRLGKAELMKDPTFYQNISSGSGSILSAARDRHGVLRKQASHGFSERAMRSQEHVIHKYADLMVERLEECIDTGKPTVDMVDWYNVSQRIGLLSLTKKIL
jgi:cytochrome P450